MGIADRDWYRRQGEDPRPVIALSVRRYAWVRWAAPVAIVAVLLAGVAYQELRISPPVPVTTKPVRARETSTRSTARLPMQSRSQRTGLLWSIDGLGPIGTRRLPSECPRTQCTATGSSAFVIGRPGSGWRRLSVRGRDHHGPVADWILSNCDGGGLELAGRSSPLWNGHAGMGMDQRSGSFAQIQTGDRLADGGSRECNVTRAGRLPHPITAAGDKSAPPAKGGRVPSPAVPRRLLRGLLGAVCLLCLGDWLP